MDPNPVKRVVAAAGSRAKLAERWSISVQAIHEFVQKGYLPIDRAKDAAVWSGVPLRELVRPDIRKVMEQGVADHLLSE
jgi:hypothetical protein